MSLTPLGVYMVGLHIACGWLAWRGGRNLWHTLAAGALAPVMALILFCALAAMVIGREAVLGLPHTVLALGVTAALGVVVWFYGD